MTHFLLQYAAKKVLCKMCRERWIAEESQDFTRECFQQRKENMLAKLSDLIMLVRQYIAFLHFLSFICMFSGKLSSEQILLYRTERSAVYFHFYVVHWKLFKECYFRASFKYCQLPYQLVMIYKTINFSASVYECDVVMNSLFNEFLYQYFS